MIADSAPVNGFKGSRGGVDVKLAPLAGFFLWFAQGLAVEGEAVRSVHEAVEDGISDRGVDDHLVPVIDGELTGDDGRAAAVAIVDDFEQIAALLRGQRRQAPVVEDQQLDTGEALEEACIASIAACQRQCVEQAWHAIVEHRSIVTAGLVAERAGKPALAGAGRAHDIIPRNIRLKLSSIIRIIPAPANASSLSGDWFTGVAFTL
jgi:hypothetical protein